MTLNYLKAEPIITKINSLAFSGAKIWNALPLSLKEEHPLRSLNQV